MERKKIRKRISKEKNRTMPKTERKSMAEMLDLDEFTAQTKKALAWWIDSSEDVAKRGLEFQKRTTAWAKDTPLQKVFEQQQEFTEKLIENSASLARKFWRIGEPDMTEEETI